jgi:inositol transporter-like SP family MFS transporter
MSTTAAAPSAPEAEPALKPWRVTVLAGMASYIDAGTLIALGSSLALWQAEFTLSAIQVGLLSALLSVCVGIGAIFGGRIGDRFGRKRVYSLDLLVFAFGTLWIVFAAGGWMLFVGAVIIGLAVGADVPASLALVAEMAPAAKRGRMVTFTQVMWTIGPLTMTIIALAFSGLGDGMPRFVFGILFVVALVTWVFRRRIKESTIWEKTKAAGETNRVTRSDLKRLVTKPLLRGLLFTGIFYAVLTLGTSVFGSFGLYAIVTVGKVPTSTALLLSLALSPIGLIALLIMMRGMDGGARRILFYVGTGLQVVAWGSLLFVPINVITLVVAFVPYLIGGTIAGEAHYKVWSQEIFPTAVRGSAVGITFGVARILSAVFAVFVPTLILSGFTVLVIILLAVAVVGGVLGILLMPKKIGESITTIDSELTTA